MYTLPDLPEIMDMPISEHEELKLPMEAPELSLTPMLEKLRLRMENMTMMTSESAKSMVSGGR